MDCHDAAAPRMGGVWLLGALLLYTASLSSLVWLAKDTSRKGNDRAALSRLERQSPHTLILETPPVEMATEEIRPVLWHFSYPPEIAFQLVLWDNPRGPSLT